MTVSNATLKITETLWWRPYLAIFITQHKTDHIKRMCFKIRYICEHGWVTMKTSDGELAEFLARTTLPMLMISQKSIFGSRTNAICLYFKVVLY